MTVRVATYNVHAWTDADGRFDPERTMAEINALDADVIGLQEIGGVGADELRSLFVRCDGKQGQHIVVDSLWNAIVSRHPITRQMSLEIASTRGMRGEFANLRHATFVEVAVPGAAPLRLINTHLTDGREDVRVRQCEHILQWAEENGFGDDSVIVGDFNAVRVADHTERDLRAIDISRDAAGLLPSSNDVIEAMDAAGYLDCYRLHVASRGISTPETWEAIHTSRYKVRIDYVWLPQSCPWTLHSYRVQRNKEPASDHFPVVVDLIQTS